MAKIPFTLRIGVLIPTAVQLLDLASVDLLAMLSKSYLTRAKMPSLLVSLGVPEVEIFYIAESKDDARQSRTTTAGTMRITHTVDDVEVQPGRLDIIHIPGPFLPPDLSDKVKNFVRAHRDFVFEHESNGKRARKVQFLVVCTGIFVAGACGLLQGRNVTGPRFLLFDLQVMYPGANWDWERRWVCDGNVWTCGTICNGLDMIGAFMLENYPKALVETILFAAQVPDRGQKYESTELGAGFARRLWWFVSLVLATLGFKFV